MRNILAQADFGTLSGYGPLGNPTGNGVGIFTTFLSSAVGLMTVIAVIWFVFVFFTGAIGIIGAGSDKAAVESNRKRIITGITGIVVTFLALLLIRLIGYLIGIPGILDLEQMLGPAIN